MITYLLDVNILIRFGKKLLQKLRLKVQASNWNDIVKEIGNMKCNNSIGSVLRRISLGAVVYNIWKERNGRIFIGEKKDADCLFKVITDGIKKQLMSLQVKNSNAVNIVAYEWDVKFRFKET
ncbi:Phytosulfokine [Artemisia annua]|uniref:Phytosulfokine n=1 Tax=Artemisia annua TaxID=35608 RepID=A0A2U1L9M0_ARTAN|nr:Phytosulfokine [Artemisia annua]